MGGLQEQMLERDNLLLAVHRATLGRRQQPTVQNFLENLDCEMDQLREKIASGRLECGDAQTFTIFDPKERKITAPAFRERVLHHAIISICGPVLDRRLIHHCYACRPGKGQVAALAYAQSASGAWGWFLKLDVRKYFDSISRSRLEVALSRVFREETVVGMLVTLAGAYSADAEHGLAIGTLVSQHLANFFLSPLDLLVLQQHRPGGYVRYMDDIAIWAGDAEGVKRLRSVAVAFAAEGLGLEFKTAYINRTAHGATTPGPTTATATHPATGTTTSVSGPVPAPADSGSALVEQDRLPVPPNSEVDKTKSSRRRLVTGCADAPSDKAGGGSAMFLFSPL